MRPSGLTLDGRGVENFARVRVPVGKQLAKSIPAGISHIWVTWESNQIQPGVPSNFCWKRIWKLTRSSLGIGVGRHSNLSQIGLCHTSYCQCSGFRQGREHHGQNAQPHAKRHHQLNETEAPFAEILGDATSCMSHLYQLRVRRGTLEFEIQPILAATTLRKPCP